MSNSSLTQKLQLSVSRLPELPLSEALALVREIQADFKALPRTGVPPLPPLSMNEIVAIKYQMQHWKQQVLKFILAKISPQTGGAGVPVQQERLVFALLAILELKPSKEQLQMLAAWVNERDSAELREGAAFYFAQIAEHKWLKKFSSKSEKALRRLAGPALDPPILGNTPAPARWTFENWTRHPEFQSYQFEQEGVRYRGLGFLPGDLLLTNVNRDGNGIYTALIEPRGYAYHVGIFAMLEHEGKILPSVIETYKLGVRAVPLSCFLAPKFSSYIEVYRVKDRPAGFSEKINAILGKLPDQTRGYNFDTEDPNAEYLSCTSIGRLAIQSAGGPRVSTKSRYLSDPAIQKNLEILDFVNPAFLSPSDFINDPAMSFVGVVDNNHFEHNVARELCERYFVEIFRKGELSLSRLPLMFWLNRFGIRQMRSGHVLGKLIGMPYGLTKQNLPIGPEKVLAVVEIYEHSLARSVRRLVRPISGSFDPNQILNIDELMQAPGIQELLKKELRPGTYGFTQIKSDIAQSVC